jgi:UDP-N-acetylglucosamine 2-epimerase (non-hydrolysing)
VGNPGIDALYQNVQPVPVELREKRVMVTLHRRESGGPPMDAIVKGLAAAAFELPDSEILWPGHPNGLALDGASKILWPTSVHLVPPMEPLTFQLLLASSQAVLTDSGGVQEEAAALGIPCVVARDVTDRPESVASGHALLAGRTAEGVRDALLKAINGWSEPFSSYEDSRMPTSPFLGFGDGHASERIADLLFAHFGD